MSETVPSRFLFLANQPCLDFVNTEMVVQGWRVDTLGDFGDLLSWLVQADLLSPDEAETARGRWAGRREAQRVLKQALALRAALREMAERLAMGKPVPPATVEAINEVLRHGVGFPEVVPTRRGFAREVRPESVNPMQLLVPVAEAAATLLCEGDLSLVRRCDNDRCILVFLDTTKSHTRRWCSMSACGNRSKVAAHQRRQRDRSGG